MSRPHREIPHRRIGFHVVVDILEPMIEPVDDEIGQVDLGLRTKIDISASSLTQAGMIPWADNQFCLLSGAGASTVGLHQT